MFASTFTQNKVAKGKDNFSRQRFKSISRTLYYLMYSCTNPIFGKHLVPEIWNKMLVGNQIAGLLNQLYLSKKTMKKHDFFPCWCKVMKVDWKILGCAWSKIVVETLAIGLYKLAVSQEGNGRIAWFLVYLYKFRKAKSYYNIFD